MPKEKIKKERKKFWGEFKTFISKGSVVDLAVALVIGTAFNKIVSQLVDSFITPLIGIVVGGFSLNDLKWVYKEAVLDTDGETVLETEPGGCRHGKSNSPRALSGLGQGIMWAERR